MSRIHISLLLTKMFVCLPTLMEICSWHAWWKCKKCKDFLFPFLDLNLWDQAKVWSLGECYRSKQQIWVGSFLSFSHQFAQRAHHKHILNSFSALVKYFLRQVEHLNIEYWGFSSSNEAQKFFHLSVFRVTGSQSTKKYWPKCGTFYSFHSPLSDISSTLSAQFKHKQFILWRYYSWLWGVRRERFTGTAHMKEIQEVYISINV